MKKWMPYIALGFGMLLMLLLFIASINKKNRFMDERITLRMKDKIPYGLFVAYHLLSQVFPSSKIYYDKQNPGNWDSVSNDASNQVVFLIASEFDAEQYELEKLYKFARQGNFVYIIAHHLSYDADVFFNCTDNVSTYDFLDRDSLEVSLESPPFHHAKSFIFPGKTYESYFSGIDTTRTQVLGRGTTNGVNFIRLKAGTGAVFIHLSPLAFSNYFLLHKNNALYYQNVLSVLPKTASKIIWNDYYITRQRSGEQRDPSWFRVLMGQPSFRWGLLTAMGALLLFVLLEMRRRQSMIPEWQQPKNDSLDFVKTIGRLYYDRGDHKNLARKMSAHFFDHLRTKYKVPTHTIDGTVVEMVHLKSGYPLQDTNILFQQIEWVETSPEISEKELNELYKALALFYQNT